ncbi:MAG: response regulator [Methyloligellaceae bacterium]
MTLIICVEDEAELREGIVEELREEGYEVIEASDGQEGLELIVQHKPALVVSDITMPRMNSLEMLRNLRQRDDELSEIPLIFLSALAHKHYYDEAKQLSATNFLIKPVDWDVFLTVVAGTVK